MKVSELVYPEKFQSCTAARAYSRCRKPPSLISFFIELQYFLHCPHGARALITEWNALSFSTSPISSLSIWFIKWPVLQANKNSIDLCVWFALGSCGNTHQPGFLMLARNRHAFPPPQQFTLIQDQEVSHSAQLFVQFHFTECLYTEHSERAKALYVQLQRLCLLVKRTILSNH